ncbi:hypothetical protein F511_23378 [Dorcoceras hygrometricum]|uniref:C2H2-type domain-containing protein n=1 Tax=Dorcoceras hygrometricum TaxID=472368 RepID=A0A2Z7B8B9_9LAMI|nr:hypothetical protein F511_23378 [Dorcoceras hygrometricum]
MEEDRSLRFVCKFCNKKYPCGKSLGGHIRSHVIANSAESERKVESSMKRNSSSSDDVQQNFPEFVNGQSSYGLRENPKKTWRAAVSGFEFSLERVCKQCGKGFQSMKALCGHMAVHSERDKVNLKDDQSWTSENQKLVVDSSSDTEVEDWIVRTRSSKSKRYDKVIPSSPFNLANNGPLSVSEIDGNEQEEVAVCLMLLSMDYVNRGGVYSFVESSDNNSAVLETKSSSIDMRSDSKYGLNFIHNRTKTNQVKKLGDRKIKETDLDAEIIQMEDSDSGYFLDECAKVESDVSFDGFCRNDAFVEGSKSLVKENGDDDGHRVSNSTRIGSRKRNPNLWEESCFKTKNGALDAEAQNYPQKRRTYECLNCTKIFNSFQALGGHRPCHKRNNANESRYESDENSLHGYNDFRTDSNFDGSTSSRKLTAKDSFPYAEKKIKPQKSKAHICPFCQRVFKNGQALGGHKRSHFLGGGRKENTSESPVTKPKIPDLLDLNLPAPQEDEEDGDSPFFRV